MPEDIAGISNDDLAALRQQAEDEFNALYEGGATAESLARATELADAIEALNGEAASREQAAAEAAAALDAQRQRVDALRAQAQPEGEDDPEGGDDGGDESDEAPAEQAAQEPALVADATPPTQKRKTDVRDVLKGGPSLNARFADAARRAPNPQVPERRDDLVIVAATPTAGTPIGARIGDLDSLVNTVASYAKGTPVTSGSPNFVPLATIQNRFDVTLSDRTSPAEVERRIKELTGPQALQAMVAAGGWCAPSEIRYDFFNIACTDGVIDLPTIGIERGGIRWPVSPSLADVFSGSFTNATNPWVWTEADDIAAVTGSPTKPCVRVPCPDFSEARLECYGICLTAGNLTDNAYPEATRNYLALLMAAHERAMNTRYIAQMVAGSTNVGAIGAAGSGTAAPLLGAIELAAIDYRDRYGMCRGDILEVVLPTWAYGAIRSDLAKRTGVDMLDVSDEMIARWFDRRGVRVQLVTDYQVRASGFPGYSTAATSWPTTLEFMIYAAGTWVRGNGMSLDLGVVRDSTLNATNDHTAAWTEECHLMARFGHESRRYAVAICTDGTTGANDLTACGV
jgi:hypothetical protein